MLDFTDLLTVFDKKMYAVYDNIEKAKNHCSAEDDFFKILMLEVRKKAVASSTLFVHHRAGETPLALPCGGEISHSGGDQWHLLADDVAIPLYARFSPYKEPELVAQDYQGIGIKDQDRGKELAFNASQIVMSDHFGSNFAYVLACFGLLTRTSYYGFLAVEKRAKIVDDLIVAFAMLQTALRTGNMDDYSLLLFQLAHDFTPGNKFGLQLMFDATVNAHFV